MKAILLLFGCLGCAVTKNQVDIPLNLLNNRASLEFVVKGRTYAGTATLPRNAGIGTGITFKLLKDTILFQLDNCAREHVKIRPTGSTYTYVYNPSIFKEAEDSCIMQAQATTYTGEMQSAIIDWTDSRKLKARMWCNEAQDTREVGVAFCQNRATKLMWLDFDEPVVWAVQEGCNDPTVLDQSTSALTLEISVTEGLCAYGFMSQSKEKFRLTTYGYNTILEVTIESESIGR